MAMETSGAVTVTWVSAVTVPIEAVTVVVPGANEVTMPALTAALLTVATDGADEFHTADRRVPIKLPLLSYPVAIRGRLVPGVTIELEGEIVIDASSGRPRLAGW